MDSPDGFAASHASQQLLPRSPSSSTIPYFLLLFFPFFSLPLPTEHRSHRLPPTRRCRRSPRAALPLPLPGCLSRLAGHLTRSAARSPTSTAMASGQDSSGTTLMDLITSDPSAAPASGASAQQSSSGGGSLGRPAVASADRKSKKSTLMQIQNETISAAKALNPVKALPQRNRKKKPVSYTQLAQSIHELAANTWQTQ